MYITDEKYLIENESDRKIVVLLLHYSVMIMHVLLCNNCFVLLLMLQWWCFVPPDLSQQKIYTVVITNWLTVSKYPFLRE